MMGVDDGRTQARQSERSTLNSWRRGRGHVPGADYVSRDGNMASRTRCPQPSGHPGAKCRSDYRSKIFKVRKITFDSMRRLTSFQPVMIPQYSVSRLDISVLQMQQNSQRFYTTYNTRRPLIGTGIWDDILTHLRFPSIALLFPPEPRE